MSSHIIRDYVSGKIIHTFRGEVPRKEDAVSIYHNGELVCCRIVRVEWEMKSESRAILMVSPESGHVFPGCE